MKLVDNAKQCWRWLSVQIPALNIAFLGTWSVLPAKFQDALPMPWVIGIAACLIVLGVIGRLYKQDLPKLDGK
jgi:protein-S-isoprenylcysteine O-methyltransferase Ste14